MRAKTSDVSSYGWLKNDLPGRKPIRRRQWHFLRRVEPYEEIRKLSPKRLEGWKAGKLVPEHVFPLREDLIVPLGDGLHCGRREFFEGAFLAQHAEDSVGLLASLGSPEEMDHVIEIA